MKAPVKQGDIIFQWLLFRGYRDSRAYRESREGGGRQKEGPPILYIIFLIVLHRDGGYGGYGDCGENSGLSHLF